MPPCAKALTLTDAVSTMDTLVPVSSICDRATCLARSWAMMARSREGNCDATPGEFVSTEEPKHMMYSIVHVGGTMDCKAVDLPCAVNCEVGALLPEI
jgi:hypothetical protein